MSRPEAIVNLPPDASKADFDAVKEAFELGKNARERLTTAERIQAVIRDMPPIGKDERAPGNMGGYSFRGIEAITAHLKPLLAKHGLCIVPQVLERVESHRTIGNGKTMYAVDLHVAFFFFGSDDSQSVVGADVWGQGTDMGDKATQKAMTSAFKSMLGIVFCIADSDTDSERHSVEESSPAERRQEGRASSPAREVAPGPPPPEGFATHEESHKEIEFCRNGIKTFGLEDWVKDQNFPWPWPKAACDAIAAKIAAETKATDPF